ncbi:MAG: hypothetical protein ABEJ86_04395 [Halococcoides sp.]
MAADELRSFLLEIIEDDPDIRDRLVAFAGEDTGKTVYDYKQEIGRLFDSAAGRGGLIEYDTHVDWSVSERESNRRGLSAPMPGQSDTIGRPIA